MLKPTMKQLGTHRARGSPMALATSKLEKTMWIWSYTALEGKTSKGFERVGKVAPNGTHVVELSHQNKFGPRQSVCTGSWDDGAFQPNQWRKLTSKGQNGNNNGI